MKVTKYAIYDYWKDKAITNSFEVRHIQDCTPEDKAEAITDLPDTIFCWACCIPPYQTYSTKSLKALWNQDHLLQRAHILAKSKGGEDKPENLFLLCPDCHTEAPDTTNPQNFFAWVYYKRTEDMWPQVLMRELERAAKIKGVDMKDIIQRCHSLGMEFHTISRFREQISKNCALHGTSISMLSKMMSFIDVLIGF